MVAGEESFQVSQDPESKRGCHSLRPHSSPQGVLHFHFALGPTNDVAGLAPRLPTQQKGQHTSPREGTAQSRARMVRGAEMAESAQSLSCVRLFVTPWTAACRASLSITHSWSLLTLMSIELVRPCNHLNFCHSLLPPSVFPSIRVFSNESVLPIRWQKYWCFSSSISRLSQIGDKDTQCTVLSVKSSGLS